MRRSCDTTVCASCRFLGTASSAMSACTDWRPVVPRIRDSLIDVARRTRRSTDLCMSTGLRLDECNNLLACEFPLIDTSGGGTQACRRRGLELALACAIVVATPNAPSATDTSPTTSPSGRRAYVLPASSATPWPVAPHWPAPWSRRPTSVAKRVQRYAEESLEVKVAHRHMRCLEGARAGRIGMYDDRSRST